MTSGNNAPPMAANQVEAPQVTGGLMPHLPWQRTAGSQLLADAAITFQTARQMWPRLWRWAWPVTGASAS
jgi:hypothetical protein